MFSSITVTSSNKFYDLKSFQTTVKDSFLKEVGNRNGIHLLMPDLEKFRVSKLKIILGSLSWILSRGLNSRSLVFSSSKLKLTWTKVYRKKSPVLGQVKITEADHKQKRIKYEIIVRVYGKRAVEMIQYKRQKDTKYEIFV